MYGSGTSSAQYVVSVDGPASGGSGAEVDAMGLESFCAGIEDNPICGVIPSAKGKGKKGKEDRVRTSVVRASGSHRCSGWLVGWQGCSWN